MIIGGKLYISLPTEPNWALSCKLTVHTNYWKVQAFVGSSSNCSWHSAVRCQTCPPLQNDLSDSLTRLPVLSGRPNVRALLSQAVMENKGEDCVGVFAAGPSSMIQDVKVECATYNASCNIPHLDFHSHAFEL